MRSKGFSAYGRITVEACGPECWNVPLGPEAHMNFVYHNATIPRRLPLSLGQYHPGVFRLYSFRVGSRITA